MKIKDLDLLLDLTEKEIEDIKVQKIIDSVIEKVEEPWLFKPFDEDFFNMLRKKYNITNEDIKKNALRQTEDGYKTSFKELVGDAYIRREGLFRFLFPGLVRFEKITNEDEQKSGIDYKVYLKDGTVKNVDLKSLIGPNYKQCVIELSQNGIWTNTPEKKTDYVLYVVHDKNHTAYKMVSYKDVLEESLKYKDFQSEKIKTSFNGTGKYILVWSI